MAIDINIDSQVQTYANFASFPAEGSVKTIYIAQDTALSYYWENNTYNQLSGGSGGSQTLQDITDNGNSTTNPLISSNNGYITTIYNDGIVSESQLDNTSAALISNGTIELRNTNGIISALQSTNTTEQVILEFPDKLSGSYTIATTDDINDYVSIVKHEVKAGEALTKGQAVYVSSADGTNMIVSKASNTTEGLSSKTMGLIITDLPNNGIGEVITEGLLTGLNTNSANAGDPVWLGTNGNLIYGLANKPYAPAHLVYIGIVTRKNANNGEIFVRVQNGFEVKELHDVSAQSPTNGDSLVYNSSNSLWEATTTKLEVLHAWDSVNSYDYMGVAKYGTATSATTWTITRIVIASDGTTTKGTATGSWNNRASLIYT